MTLGAAEPFEEAFPLLYVFGAGGHGREVAWLARECLGPRVKIAHVVDHAQYLVPHLHGNPVLLLDELACESGARYVAAVGDSLLRERATAACEARGLAAVPLVHPRAVCSGQVDIGGGSVVCAGAVITVDVRLGRHVHINVGCTVSHDCVVSDFATLCPGVHVAGHVHIGRRAFVGAGATIINGRPDEPLTIGDDAIVAAGACVVASVPNGALVAGVPATRRR